MAFLKPPILNLILTVAILTIQPTNGQDEINSVKGGYWYMDGGLPASDIDSTLFTHLFCAFANVSLTTYEVTITPECATFPQTVRQRSPSVITLLSIGGGSLPSYIFNQTASQPDSRQAFINSSIRLARASEYDGLDLDWEGMTEPAEMTNMATLLNEWRAALDDEAASSGADRLILTAAVAVSPQLNDETTFPTEEIATNLDWANVMAYDFYTPTSVAVTRAPAALYDPTGGPSGSSGIQAWIDAGVPASQLVLGFPFYGYAWQLVNPLQHGLFSAAAGIDSTVGDPEDGSVAYSQIRTFVRDMTATVVYDASYATNYCYSGSTWIGYDDVQAIAAKVTYARDNGLFGYVAWQIAQDYQWTLSIQASQTWGPASTVAAA